MGRTMIEKILGIHAGREVVPGTSWTSPSTPAWPATSAAPTS
jgi:hypothetical protein